jgi:hypothetical protein
MMKHGSSVSLLGQTNACRDDNAPRGASNRTLGLGILSIPLLRVSLEDDDFDSYRLLAVASIEIMLI